MTAIDSAVVLAAGEGSRLRPLTRYRPKPMLPVANRPIIEYVIDALLGAGVTDIVVVVGHRHTRIQDVLQQRYPDCDLTYVQQNQQLGSGDALLLTREAVPEQFVVVNGDNVIDERIVTETVETFCQSDVAGAVAVAHAEQSSEYGTVCTENGRITTILEHETEDHRSRINVGVYAFDDRIFAALENTPVDAGELALTDAIPHLSVASVNGSRVLPAVPDGVWFDPAYPWDLLSITEQLQSTHETLVPGSRQQHESARVHDAATVEDGVLVGPGCEVGAGAVLRSGTCLQSDVRVGANTVLTRTVVGSATSIGDGATLRDSVVGADVVVGPGTTAPGGPADFVVNGQVHRDRQLGSIVSDRTTVGGNVTMAPGTQIHPDTQIQHGSTVVGTVGSTVEVSH